MLKDTLVVDRVCKDARCLATRFDAPAAADFEGSSIDVDGATRLRIVICDGERSRAVLTPCSVRDVDSHGQIHIVGAISDIEPDVVAASLRVNDSHPS